MFTERVSHGSIQCATIEVNFHHAYYCFRGRVSYNVMPMFKFDRKKDTHAV